MSDKITSRQNRRSVLLKKRRRRRIMTVCVCAAGAVLLAAVVRGGKSFTPDGKTVLNPGDKAIVITAGNSILDLDDILAR